MPGSQAAPNGFPAQKIYLVRNGVLENLIYSRFWAKQKDKQPTPGPVNNIMESSRPPVSLEEMIQATDRGLLIGRFWYIRGVDPRTALQTGLTRDGIWYIENGKIKHPVNNFRFNQSLMQLLAPGNVEMIGAPERVGSSEAQGSNAALLPALKVKSFTSLRNLRLCNGIADLRLCHSPCGGLAFAEPRAVASGCRHSIGEFRALVVVIAYRTLRLASARYRSRFCTAIFKGSAPATFFLTLRVKLPASRM